VIVFQQMSAEYPETPEGWEPFHRRSIGPFTTHVTFQLPGGELFEWSSRRHRKHASLLSRERHHPEVWWAPRSASWWIGVLFAVGSSCFLVGPFPGFVELVGSTVDGIVFFVGSIFFTSAATLQFAETANADRGPAAAERQALKLLTFEPHRIDWWSCAVQVAGTVFFNISTFHALKAGLDTTEYNRLVWAPDALGSICFLVSGYLAYLEVCGRPACRPRRVLEWWIAGVNLLGCVAFGISAIASYVVPKTGSALDLARANSFTAFGALCFLIGAALLLAESAE
jgi:YrhK-like protein